VHGDSVQSYLVAVVVPEKGKNKEDADKDEDLKKQIMSEMEAIANENGFSSLEKVKKIYLSSEPFTLENDLMTPTFKVKRNVAQKYFEDEIKELYDQKGEEP